jgi:hypothetical protein
MIGLYLFAAVLGGGLLAMSVFGADADAASDAGSGNAIAELHGAAEMLLGIFRLRNLTFLFATFGITGAVLTWLGASSGWAFTMAIIMGLGAMIINHALFAWLRRADSAGNLVDENDLVGMNGRVVLTVAPGERGRIVCTVAGREQYIVARLASGQSDALVSGREIVVVGMTGGVAEIAPFDALPSGAHKSLTE